jgi:hypothetical protein
VSYIVATLVDIGIPNLPGNITRLAPKFFVRKVVADGKSVMKGQIDLRELKKHKKEG